MNEFFMDLRYGLRTLMERRNAALTAAAVLSLALGIGANTAIFSLVNEIIMKPVAKVKEPEDLVWVYGSYERGGDGPLQHLPLSYLDARDYLEYNDVFSDGFIFQYMNVNMSTESESELIRIYAISRNFFEVVGVDAAVGRTFSTEEDQGQKPDQVIVLSHALWNRSFGADPDVVGRTLKLNNYPFTVIGVAAEGFKGMRNISVDDAWIPLEMYEYLAIPLEAEMLEQRDGRMLNCIARLKPGVTEEQAQAAMTQLARQFEQQYPETNEKWGTSLLPVPEMQTVPGLQDTWLRAATLLGISTGVVLLIACINISNLLLARASKRHRELAIRLSLGANRRRIIRQLVTESVLLAIIGGALSLLVAKASLHLIWGFRPPFMQRSAIDLNLDVSMLFFTLAVTLVAGVLVGLVPALKASKLDLVSSLKSDKETVVHPKMKARNLLVVAQVFLCLMCLVGTSYFLQSLRNAQKTDLGFETDRLLFATVRLSGAGYDEVRGREFSRILLERLNNLPGVEAASMAENPSLFVHGFLSQVRAEEHGEADASLISTNIVTEGYFDTIGMPILQGRAFSTVDHRESVRVAIVNETLVQRFWPDEDPVGKRFRLDNEEEWIEVVGVAKQSKYFTMGEPPQPYIYLHSLQSYRADVTFFVRAAGNPKNLISAVRQEIKALEIDMPILNLRTVNDLITESLWATRMAVGLLGFFGVLALCLAAIGVYGITAYTVNQRRTEFGMRMALGARRTDLAGLLFKEITVVMLLGLGIGWISTFILGRTLDRLLYGVDTSALLPLIGTSLFLAAIVLIASVFPVYRATASDPAAALRVE